MVAVGMRPRGAARAKGRRLRRMRSRIVGDFARGSAIYSRMALLLDIDPRDRKVTI
jgi:hypothetical protein